MNWKCPYCSRDTTIVSINKAETRHRIETVKSKYAYVYLQYKAIACPNSECNELTLSVDLKSYNSPYTDQKLMASLGTWQLLPSSLAKPQPHYIPEAIKADYYEACAILTLSPKASATLSRRCLQGIVRDYWNIPDKKRGKLGAELSYIKNQVDEDIWAGIEAIRSVGDIGAHMEKDVNYVVDVEDDEAELLIELIEMLFVDWYISRQKRQERATRAKALSKTKLDQKKAAKNAAKKSEQDEVSKA